MEHYLVIITPFSFIILLCKVLALDKLIRLFFFRIFYPKATLKDVESFEINTEKNSSLTFRNKNKEIP